MPRRRKPPWETLFSLPSFWVPETVRIDSTPIKIPRRRKISWETVSSLPSFWVLNLARRGSPLALVPSQASTTRNIVRCRPSRPGKLSWETLSSLPSFWVLNPRYGGLLSLRDLVLKIRSTHQHSSSIPSLGPEKTQNEGGKRPRTIYPLELDIEGTNTTSYIFLDAWNSTSDASNYERFPITLSDFGHTMWTVNQTTGVVTASGFANTTFHALDAYGSTGKVVKIRAVHKALPSARISLTQSLSSIARTPRRLFLMGTTLLGSWVACRLDARTRKDALQRAS
ncbi:hypothetical protein B0H14DRAFT_3138648 [Mycena olivaceomarginata]|nr:hypothetical protein B0H14DRAFT_3138648 [Mycena olivaceomarginata]